MQIFPQRAATLSWAVRATAQAMTRHLNADHAAAGGKLGLHSLENTMRAWQVFRGPMTVKRRVNSAVRLTVLELPRAGRFRAWAELTDTDAAGKISARSRIINCVCDHGDHPGLEMQSRLALVLPWFQGLAPLIRTASSRVASRHRQQI